jgi:hypothetical protein
MLDQALDGSLASMWGELHAQTASLALAGWLAGEGELDAELVRQARVADLVWAMGKLAKLDLEDPGAYGSLAAIQLGELDAVAWEATQTAANGRDRGCFAIDHASFPQAADTLGKKVFGIGARHDAAAAAALRDAHVRESPLRQVLEERWTRHPEVAVEWSLKL